MNAIRINQVNDLLEVCEGGVYISDYKVCEELRRPKNSKYVDSRFTHLRGKKIQKWASKEGAGTYVKAYGFDELGNVIAITWDNKVKQFIGEGLAEA